MQDSELSISYNKEVISHNDVNFVNEHNISTEDTSLMFPYQAYSMLTVK
jgi:hypothetical protein